jgi:hemerythrin-like domain-containing protein
LLRDHIDKENGVLFPMSDAVHEPGQQAMLAHRFEAVEPSAADAEAHVERLARDLDAARCPGVTAAGSVSSDPGSRAGRT